MDTLFALGQAEIDIDAILSNELANDNINTNTDNVEANDIEAIEGQLHKLLTPSPSFSDSWLNKLQQRWDTSVEYADVFKISPPLTRTVTRFERRGIHGRVVGYKTVTVPAAAGATAKNSTSLLRKPAARMEFVRGAAGFFPFTPGGLDSIEATAGIEDQLLHRGETAPKSAAAKLERVIKIGPHGGGMLEVAPGLSRGIKFAPVAVESEGDARAVEQELSQESDEKKDDVEKDDKKKDNDDDDDGGDEKKDDKKKDNDPTPSESSDDDVGGGVPIPLTTTPPPHYPSLDEVEIDKLLPVEFPAFEPHGLLPSSNRKVSREWAHMVDVNGTMADFYELVPDMARTWPFELDTFQKEAVYHLENGDSVFVAAHTSAGKTVVAEYAIALAAKHMTKAIYTSPIKALSNQKFRDFRQTFDDVGILTGDVQVNPEASCLIMTTEILRSMLYRGADLIRDVEFVIFDEVHYVNDLERGVVWEEVIIMLPDHVSLILLSATVPNTLEFASWVGRTKKKDIYVISTPKRPVPLEHYLWAGSQIFKIVENGRFYEKGWKEANSICQGSNNSNNNNTVARGGGNSRGNLPHHGRGDRGRGGRGGRGDRGGGGRGGGDRGRGVPNAHHLGKSGRSGFASMAQDRNLWVHLVQHLRKNSLLPACIFVFSKKRCEENAVALGNQDFCTATEKSAIHMTIERSIARLKPEDRLLPQILRLRDLLSRGIAVHHGGLLPIVKELVEILFAQTLVKVLFATETFAMGLNLPTRTVVFSGYRKHDGHSFRNLLPGEYTQMAGRAGRRGLDTVGTVIIVPPGSAGEAPPVADLQAMILGEPSKLRSQFRLTYNMILNLLRVEALKIEEMIKRSFSEHATQQLQPEHEKAVRLSEADLARVKRDPCPVCDDHMDDCHAASLQFRSLTTRFYTLLLGNPAGRKLFAPGRLIVYRQEGGLRTVGILPDNGPIAITNRPKEIGLRVLEIKAHRTARDDSDQLPFLPAFRARMAGLPQHKKHIATRVVIVPLEDVDCVTNWIAHGVVPQIWRGGQEYQSAKEVLHQLCRTVWSDNWWTEVEVARIKSLEIQEVLEARSKAMAVAINSPVHSCPDFLKHFAMCHDQHLIKAHIAQLRKSLSDQNLQLLPDYEQRIHVLADLGFVDPDSRILLKGKVAAEIHSADELVLTELVLDNVLADYEPAEIAALLSAFVFQEKTDSVPSLTPALERGRDAIIRISEKVNAVQTAHQVILSSDDSNDFVSRPRFGLAEVVYEWARGMPFKNITDLTDVLEGSIVRAITRLDETCREVKNAARIIGDPGLYRKMDAAQDLIKRDITAVASLYM